MHSTKSFFALLSMVLLLDVHGCAPRIPPEELGEVMKELPALPGTDQPYPLPELETPKAADAATAPAEAADSPQDARAAEAAKP